MDGEQPHLGSAAGDGAQPQSAYAVLERISDAFVALDAEDRWLYVNAEAERVLGRSRKELVGRVLWDVYPEARGTAFAEGLRRARAEGAQVAVSDLVASSGRWVENRIHPLPSGVLYVHFTDVTERRRAHGRAEHLGALAAALSGAVTTEEVTAAILAAALPPFSAWVGVVALLADDGKTLRVADAAGFEGGTVPEGWREFPVSAPVPLADAVRRCGVVAALSPAEYERRAYQPVGTEQWQGPEGQGGAIIAAPMLLGDRVVGSLGLICPAELVADEEGRTFLLTVADQCALALERARLFDAQREAEREAREAHARLAEVLDDMDDAFYAVDGESRFTFVNRRAEGAWGLRREDVVGRRFEDVFPQAVGSESYQHQLRAARERRPVRYEAVSPVLGRWIEASVQPTADGGLSVYFHDIDGRKRREERERFLAGLTERTRALADDPDAVVWETVRSVGAFLGLSRYLFAEVDDAAGAANILPEWEWRQSDEVHSVAGAWPVSTWGDVLGDLKAGRTVVYTDAAADPRIAADKYASAYAPHLVRASVRVPVLRGGRLVGMFSAQSAVPRDWAPEEVALLESVAERMWVALEGARVRRQEREQAARQARVAETLQRSLLITPPPAAFDGLEVVTLYESASDEDLIGGDWFEAVNLGGGRVLLAVGDNTGKGIESSLFTAELKLALKTLARQAARGGADVDPAQLLSRLNAHVTEGQELDGRPAATFVCVGVAVVNSSTGEVLAACAGMEPPLVVRAATGEWEEVPASGPILGALPDWGDPAERTVLAEGDVLLLFSDGLTEARSPETRGFFGYDGLARVASEALRDGGANLDAVSARVAAAARAFAGGAVGDDVCLLAVRLKARTGG